jgi:hypothetical protein
MVEKDRLPKKVRCYYCFAMRVQRLRHQVWQQGHVKTRIPRRCGAVLLLVRWKMARTVGGVAVLLRRHGHGDEGGMDAAMSRRQRRSSSTSLDEGTAKRGRGWSWCRHGEGVVVHDSSWREIMAMVDGVDAAGLEQELGMVDAVEAR